MKKIQTTSHFYSLPIMLFPVAIDILRCKKFWRRQHHNLEWTYCRYGYGYAALLKLSVSTSQL